MNILDNELVRLYFGCGRRDDKFCADKECNVHQETWALRFLTAMQEQIKKGEKYLGISSNGQIEIHEQKVEDECYLFHPYALRLPSRFQPTEKKECECVPVKHGANCWHWNDPTQKMGHWAEFCEHHSKPSECRYCSEPGFCKEPCGCKCHRTPSDACFKCSDCGAEGLSHYRWTCEHQNGKCKPKSEAVEEKIKEILDYIASQMVWDIPRMGTWLRELVRIARQ